MQSLCFLPKVSSEANKRLHVHDSCMYAVTMQMWKVICSILYNVEEIEIKSSWPVSIEFSSQYFLSLGEHEIAYNISSNFKPTASHLFTT